MRGFACIVFAVSLVSGAALAAGGPPSQSLVKAQIVKMLRDKVEVRAVQIAAARAILNADAARLGIPPGTTIYPVLSKFTETRLNGVVQDRTQYWYFYRDE